MLLVVVESGMVVDVVDVVVVVVVVVVTTVFVSSTKPKPEYIPPLLSNVLFLEVDQELALTPL